MKKFSIWILIAVCVVQIGATVWGPIEKSYVLAKGNVYKMKITGLDPFDPFRGRYLTINFKQDRADFIDKYNVTEEEFYSKKVYLVFGKGADGLDRIEYATVVKPTDRDYVVPKYAYLEKKVNFTMPFDSYYVNTNDATAMESVLANNIQDAYVTIRVLNDKAVLEKLYIGDKTIEQFVD